MNTHPIKTTRPRRFFLFTALLVGVLFLFISFKPDQGTNDYLIIYYNDLKGTVSISNGSTFQKIDFNKQQGFGDQTQLLQLIHMNELKGYKLVQYNLQQVNAVNVVATALMTK